MEKRFVFHVWAFDTHIVGVKNNKWRKRMPKSPWLGPLFDLCESDLRKIDCAFDSNKFRHMMVKQQ